LPSTGKGRVRLKVETQLVLGLVLVAAAVVFNQAVGFEDAYDSLSSDGSSGYAGSRKWAELHAQDAVAVSELGRAARAHDHRVGSDAWRRGEDDRVSG
jgi:hypothetical protein